MTTYTLTSSEAALYDSTDDRDVHKLRDSLRERFGPYDPGGAVEVNHPDGFVIDVYRGVPDDAELVRYDSPLGWSLHAPGATREDIALGDEPYLVAGDGEPTAADYDAARQVLAKRMR